MNLPARLVAAIAAVTIALPAAAQTGLPTGRASRPAMRSSTVPRRPNPNAAALLLSKQVEIVDWDETPFEEIIEWLRAESEDQVNVIARWSALAAESVDPDIPVTLKLKNTTVAQILLEVFDQLVDDDELGLEATGNLLKISTRSDFGRKVILRVYDVTDVMFYIPNLGEGVPRIDIQQASQQGAQGGGGGGGGGQGLFTGSSSGQGSGRARGGEQAEEDQKEVLTDLAEMITATIAPQSWTTNNPAARGTIAVHNATALIVVNTVEVHEQIAGAFVR